MSQSNTGDFITYKKNSTTGDNCYFQGQFSVPMSKLMPALICYKCGKETDKLFQITSYEDESVCLECYLEDLDNMQGVSHYQDTYKYKWNALRGAIQDKIGSLQAEIVGDRDDVEAMVEQAINRVKVNYLLHIMSLMDKIEEGQDKK